MQSVPVAHACEDHPEAGATVPTYPVTTGVVETVAIPVAANHDPQHIKQQQQQPTSKNPRLPATPAVLICGISSIVSVVVVLSAVLIGPFARLHSCQCQHCGSHRHLSRSRKAKREKAATDRQASSASPAGSLAPCWDVHIAGILVALFFLHLLFTGF